MFFILYKDATIKIRILKKMKCKNTKEIMIAIWLMSGNRVGAGIVGVPFVILNIEFIPAVNFMINRNLAMKPILLWKFFRKYRISGNISNLKILMILIFYEKMISFSRK